MSRASLFIPNRLKPWIDARRRFHLSHAYVQMVLELGLNPKKFGKLVNHRQEPWKLPLPLGPCSPQSQKRTAVKKRRDVKASIIVSPPSWRKQCELLPSKPAVPVVTKVAKIISSWCARDTARDMKPPWRLETVGAAHASVETMARLPLSAVTPSCEIIAVSGPFRTKTRFV
jgi:hypothetical protein